MPRSRPAGEPGTILALRRKRRAPAEAAKKPALDRHTVGKRLDATRDMFYDLDRDSLIERLEHIDASPYPDLDRYAARLRRVAKQRDEIERASGDAAINAKFMSAFREILVATHREGVGRKQRELAKLRSHRVRKQAQKSVRRLAKEYPDVHALERAWFDDVRNARMTLRDSRRPAGVGLGIVGIWLLFRVIAKIVEELFDR